MSLFLLNGEGIGGAQDKKQDPMALRYSSGLGEKCGSSGQGSDSEGGER